MDVKRMALKNASALLAAGLDEKTFSWWFDFLCLNRTIRVRPINLAHLVFSTNSTNLDEAPFNIVEARIEYRRPNADELRSYGYVADAFAGSCYWVIGVSGGTELTIFCDDFLLEESDAGTNCPQIR